MGQVIETDEQGCLLLSAEILAEAAAEQRLRTYNEWKREWDALSEEIGAAWPEGVSPVDVVSEMRR